MQDLLFLPINSLTCTLKYHLNFETSSYTIHALFHYTYKSLPIFHELYKNIRYVRNYSLKFMLLRIIQSNLSILHLELYPSYSYYPHKTIAIKTLFSSTRTFLLTCLKLFKFSFHSSSVAWTGLFLAHVT